MPLVTSTEMFKKAYEGGYAIGAFNVNNMEIIQGITEAAAEVSSPIILQVSAGARNERRSTGRESPFYLYYEQTAGFLRPKSHRTGSCR